MHLEPPDAPAASPPWGAGGAVRTEGSLKEKPEELSRCGAQGGCAQGRSSRGRESAGRSGGQLSVSCSQSAGLGLGVVRTQLGSGVRSPGSRQVLGGSWELGGPRDRVSGCRLVELSHPSLLCRRTASCCRLSAGPCVPAGRPGTEDPPGRALTNKSLVPTLVSCVPALATSAHRRPLESLPGPGFPRRAALPPWHQARGVHPWTRWPPPSRGLPCSLSALPF